MLAPRRDHQPVLRQRQLIQVRNLERSQRADHHVDHAVAQRLDQFAPASLQHLERGARIAPRHSRHGGGDQIGPRQWQCPERDQFAPAPAVPPDIRQRRDDLRHRQSCPARQPLARRIEPHRPSPPLDQLAADHLFQVADRAMHCCLRQGAAMRGRRETPRLRQRQEGAQLRHRHQTLRILEHARQPLGRLRQMIQRRARALDHDLAHGRRHHAARPPLEKGVAKLPLQLGQPLRQRRLRQAHHIGRGGDAAMFADRQQRAQVAQIKVERIGRHAAYSCYPAPTHFCAIGPGHL